MAKGLASDPSLPSFWSPNPGAQSLAYDSDADELYYGGAAGGGKTDLLIGLALTAHRKSHIFRREYGELEGLYDRILEVLAPVMPQVRARQSPHPKIHLPDGRVIELGAAQHDKDVRRFQGRAADLKAFDELPNFTEAQYLFLSGWTRSTDPGQRKRVVAAGNPPTTPEGQWVTRRWSLWLRPQLHPRPAAPGEIRWFAQVDGADTEVDGPEPFEHRGELLHPSSRTFIPAFLADNPHQAGTGYERILDRLPEPLRSQLKRGDFLSGAEDHTWQVIPSAWIEAAMERWTTGGHGGRGIDRIGLDVARGGRDKTVAIERRATWFGRPVVVPGDQTRTGGAVARIALGMMNGRRDVPVNVDVIGVGAAAYDALVEHGVPAEGVNFAGKTKRRTRDGLLSYVNVRAAAYWGLREALDPDRGDGIEIPPDETLKEDLVAVRWKLTMRGIQIEEKEDIRERIGRSTDLGDALALAAWDGGAFGLDTETAEEFWKR